MTTTLAAPRHPGVRSAAAPVATLGPRQFVLLAVSLLLLYGTLYFILMAPFVARHFARIGVQAHEQAFGFRLGLVDEGQIQDWHIVEVTPGGRFAQAGFRAGDFPTEYHGNGIGMLRWAIEEAASGRRACVVVWNEEPSGARREVCLDAGR
jgi:hypothetical protein